MSEEATGSADVAEATAPVDANTDGNSSEPDWSKLPDNLSGAEISKILADHKAKQGGATPKAAPKEGSAVSDAAKEALRKFKVKVEGQEMEIDEEELKRGYSHQRVASKTLNEGKQLRKQAEEFVAMLKDPEQFYTLAEKMGHDVRSLAEKKLARFIEDDLMDPQEKELRSAKSRLDEYERRDAEAKAKAKAEHMATLEKKYAAEYETQFLGALKESGLPVTKPMISEMAKYIGKSADLGFKMTVAEAAALVKEDIKQAQARLFKDADAQTLLSIFGDDLANKIRAHDVSKIKSPEEFLRTAQRSEPRRSKAKVVEARRPPSLAERVRFRNS